MATIRKRTNAWHAQIRRVGQPSCTKSFRLKADAEAWARQLEDMADRDDLPRNSALLRQITISDMLDRYRNEVTEKKRSSVKEAKLIDGLLKEPCVSLTLSNAKPSVFAQFRDQRLRTVKPATVMRQLSLLQHAFNVAQKEWDWPISRNPVAQIQKPAVQNRRNRRLKDEELRRLLDGCSASRTPWLRPIIIFAIETGMRRGEIISLRWDDVELERQIIHVRETKNGDPRTIPLTRDAMDLLTALPKVGERIFPTTANAARLAWQRLKRRAEIVDLRFHDLRHEAVSRFFERGLNLPEVALISGHRDHRMLLRYTHLKPTDISRKLNEHQVERSAIYRHAQIPSEHLNC